MSVEELKRAVLEKAKIEAEHILKKAEEEAKNIIEEAQKKKLMLIEEKKKEIVAKLNPDARIAEAKYRARLILAEAKDSIIREVVIHVNSILNSLPQNIRFESIKRLIDESIQEVLNSVGKVNSITIRVSSKDIDFIDAIKRYVEESYNIRIEGIYTTNIIGGVIVECMNGEIIIDNSYEERLKKVLRNMMPQLAKIGL
ncbi:MAG: V-type ATP synthase subunit E family protein [Ignisphaera sp.]